MRDYSMAGVPKCFRARTFYTHVYHPVLRYDTLRRFSIKGDVLMYADGRSTVFIFDAPAYAVLGHLIKYASGYASEYLRG